MVGGVAGFSQINAGWGWNWTGRERATGRVRNYYARTSYGSKVDLKAAMEAHLQGVEFIDGAPADKEPSVVMPMPPHSFQHGILDIVKRELGGMPKNRDMLRTMPLIARATMPLIPRGLIPRKTINV